MTTIETAGISSPQVRELREMGIDLKVQIMDRAL